MIDLNRDDFKVWLEAHKTYRFFLRDPCNCPLAKWVESQFTMPKIVKAYKNGVKVYSLGIEPFYVVPLPPWANKFMHQLDSEPWPTADGEACLRVLGAIESP
jgi:hypothetical protein